jgi:hypothetical protein
MQQGEQHEGFDGAVEGITLSAEAFDTQSYFP